MTFDICVAMIKQDCSPAFNANASLRPTSPASPTNFTSAQPTVQLPYPAPKLRSNQVIHPNRLGFFRINSWAQAASVMQPSNVLLGNTP